MKGIRQLLKKIRLRVNKIGAGRRHKKIIKSNPTIISNNCYAGIVYEYLGMKFYSPTIGLYFYADEYIKFCKKFHYYIKQKLKFITYKESKYCDELVRRGEQNVIIGMLDDVEIVFLHYKTEKEVKEKWERRCKRINNNCIIFKFCDQNLCTEENIKQFDSLPYKNKFCFTSKQYSNLKSTVFFSCDQKKKEVKRDYYVGHKYFDIINYINTYDYREGTEPLRILQLGMTNNLGGIETCLINYYRHIDKTKIQYDFVNIYDTSLCFSDEIKKMGGKIYQVSNYYKHPFRYVRELKKIINENNYCIVHCNMNSAAMLYPLMASKISNAKIIISHSHNASSDKGILKSIMHSINRKFIPLLATNYFACSDKAGKWFYSNKILKGNKYKVIYNAIDIKKFQFNNKIRKDKRKELNISEDTLVIGHVGRFNKQKNHEFLIEVFKDVYDINRNSILLLIGIGPLENEIKKKTKELGLIENVKFLGQRNDVNDLYNTMDIFVLPSLYEGLPLVGVEAQINDIKCLFSDTITNELSISKKCEYIKLDRKEWSKKILDYKNNERIENITSKKFDINNNSIMLSNFYKKELENVCGKFKRRK